MVALDAAPLIAALRAKALLAAMIGSFAVFTTNRRKVKNLLVSIDEAFAT